MGICEELISIYGCEKELAVRGEVSFSEKGTRYYAKVQPKRLTAVLLVDGNIIKTGRRCDRLVLSQDIGKKDSWIGHFVELKGVDVKSAIQQLEETIKHKALRSDFLTSKYARIVAHSFPSNKASDEVERARIRFKKVYSCELKCLKSGQPDKI